MLLWSVFARRRRRRRRRRQSLRVVTSGVSLDNRSLPLSLCFASTNGPSCQALSNPFEISNPKGANTVALLAVENTG